MSERVGTCQCGQIRVICQGEPVRVGICHCFECQKRSGGPFAVQARWEPQNVRTEGTPKEWSRKGDEGTSATFRFCPNCGSTVWYTNEGMDLIAVAIGAFGDTSLPDPQYSVYEARMHKWVRLPDEIEHLD